MTKKIIKTKRKSTPNYGARIRSNLNWEFVLEVKKAKNAKLLKISQSFLAFFLQKSAGHKGLKICTVCHIIIVYKCYFMKI